MEREIIHRCGHAQHHHVGGWCVADQDREATRLARKRCAACVAAEPTATAGVAVPLLPPLAGSPRQVAWAEAIRRDRLARLGRIDPAAASRIAAMVDACWWIDRRAVDPGTIAIC